MSRVAALERHSKTWLQMQLALKFMWNRVETRDA